MHVDLDDDTILMLNNKQTVEIQKIFHSLQDTDPNGINTIGLALWLNAHDSNEFLEGLARSQHMDLIEFLKTKADSNKGLNVWHMAAWGGNVDLLNLLDSAYLKSIKNDAVDASLTHYFARSGNYSALKQGITESWPWINATSLDRGGASIWHYLALSGNYAALTQAIKDKQFDPLKLVDKSGKNVWFEFRYTCDYKDLLQAIEAGYCNPSHTGSQYPQHTIFEMILSLKEYHVYNRNIIICAEIWRTLVNTLTKSHEESNDLFFYYFNNGMNNEIEANTCATFIRYYTNQVKPDDFSFYNFIFNDKVKYYRKLLPELTAFVTNIAAEVDSSVFLEFYVFLQMKRQDVDQLCIEPLLHIVKKEIPIEDYFWQFVSVANRNELLNVLDANKEGFRDGEHLKGIVAKLKEINMFDRTIFDDVLNNKEHYMTYTNIVDCAKIWKKLTYYFSNRNLKGYLNYCNNMNNEAEKNVCAAFFQYYLNKTGHDYSSFIGFIFDNKNASDPKSINSFIQNIAWNNQPNIFKLIGEYKDPTTLQALNAFITNMAAKVDPSVFLEFYMFLQMKRQDLNQLCIEPLLQIVKKEIPTDVHFWEFVSPANRKELLHTLIANEKGFGDSKYLKEVIAKLKELNSPKARPN